MRWLCFPAYCNGPERLVSSLLINTGHWNSFGYLLVGILSDLLRPPEGGSSCSLLLGKGGRIAAAGCSVFASTSGATSGSTKKGLVKRQVAPTHLL